MNFKWASISINVMAQTAMILIMKLKEPQSPYDGIQTVIF